MTDDLKNQLDSFIKYIIGKIDQKDLNDIQNKYNEFIEFYAKYSILTNEDFESLMNEYDSLQEEVKKCKNQNIIDSDKIRTMKEELDKNMELNNKYKKLNEDYNILKQKYNVCHNDNTDFQMKLKDNEKLINDLQIEISNSKKENFEKFEKITELEKNFKLNEIKLAQTNENLNKFNLENNNLKKENSELKNNYLEQQRNYQNKILVLEKQIKNLTDANQNFIQENNDVQAKLKDFQIYTNMAKIHKTILKPEDFSILENMSNRAEKAELDLQKSLSVIEDLKALNEKLRNKIKPLEDYALLQIKYDHEINTGIDTIYDLKNRIFTDEERNEIDKLKKEPGLLLQSLIKLKTENLELHNQLKDITIECNQQLRQAKRK